MSFWMIQTHAVTKLDTSTPSIGEDKDNLISQICLEPPVLHLAPLINFQYTF
jgi:hypothetical protein